MWCCGPVAVILVQIRYIISNELMDWMGERCPGILPFRSESRLSVSLLAPTRVVPSGLLSENRKHTCHNDFALVFFVKCFQIFFYFFFSLFSLHLNLSHKSASRGCCQSESSSTTLLMLFRWTQILTVGCQRQIFFARSRSLCSIIFSRSVYTPVTAASQSATS